MEQARQDFREAKRADALTSQLQRWRLAKELDDYLSEMRLVIVSIADEQAREAAARWLTWAARHREKIDPLQQPLAMPPDPDPTAEDLTPFLRGWSPSGPNSYV